MSKRWGIGRWETAALLAGLLLRAAFVAKHALFGGDTLLYADLAHNLRLHHVFGFTEDTGIRPTLIRLPGYPLFLAACFAVFGESNFLAVLWVQVAVDLATCLLLWKLATNLFGRRAGLATLWLAALCPFTANYAAVPITECWSLFCVALAFYALERWVQSIALEDCIPPPPRHPERRSAASCGPQSKDLQPFPQGHISPTLSGPSPTEPRVEVEGGGLQSFEGEGGLQSRNPPSNQQGFEGAGLQSRNPHSNQRSFEGAGLQPRHTTQQTKGGFSPGGNWALVLGIALSFAVLLRPDQGLLAAAVLPVMLWVAVRKGLTIKALPSVAITTLILILPLTLWAARNWQVFHVLQPLAPRYANDPGEPNPYGFQRWYRTWAIDFKATVDVYWTYDGTTVSFDNLPPRAFDSASQRATTEALFNDYNRNTTSTPTLDAAFAKLAAERIAAHPLRYYVVLPTARVLDMWIRPRTELMRLPVDWWNWRPHPGQSAAAFVYALWNAAYLALGLVGLRRWHHSNWSGLPQLALAMLGFVILRSLLLLTLDNSEPRYTLECFPVVILLAGLALTSKTVGLACPIVRPIGVAQSASGATHTSVGRSPTS